MREAVLWIGIRIFLGLPDPDPPLFCTYPDLDPDPCITRKKSKKNLDFYYFATSQLSVGPPLRRTFGSRCLLRGGGGGWPRPPPPPGGGGGGGGGGVC
jgi:hypothetical protein